MLNRRLLFLVASALLLGLLLIANIYTLSASHGESPQEPEEPILKTATTTVAKPLIQLLLPITSLNLKKPAKTVLDLPLFEYALPSVIDTIEPDRFRYLVSLGMDKGDPWYDNADRQAQIRSWFLKTCRTRWTGRSHCPLELTFHAYGNTRSRPTWVTNYMTQWGYDLGVDYFYRINDDTILKPNKWSTAYVNILAGMRPIPGLGVTGPCDPVQKCALLTMSFVGRPHIECFGTHFPYLFGAYWADDWIMYVYTNPDREVFGEDALMMVVALNVTITHVVLQPRYEITATLELYKSQLAIGRKELNACGERFIRSQKNTS